MAYTYSSLCSTGEVVTVGTSVAVLTPATYLHAMSAHIEVVSGVVRFHHDGRVPTGTTGKVRFEGGIIELVSLHEIRSFQAIRDSTSVADAMLDVTYRK